MKIVLSDAPHDVVVVAAVDAPIERVVSEQLQAIMHVSGERVIVCLIAAMVIADENFTPNRFCCI